MAEATSRKLKHWVLPLVLLAGALPYAVSLQGPFVFDDLPGIRDNPYLTQFWPLTAPADTAPYGRPAIALALAVQHALWGLLPLGYHLASLALHLVNGILVWLLLKRLLRPSMQWATAGITLLWLVHPIQSEAVAYASQQTELIFALCLLGTLNCWVRQRYKLAILICAIGMTCKETMVVAPVLALLIDRIMPSSPQTPSPDLDAITEGHEEQKNSRKQTCSRIQDRSSFRGYFRGYFRGGLFATWGILAGLMLTFPRSQSTGFDHGLSAWHYLLTQSRVICHYLHQVLWPTRLSIDINFPIAQSIGDIWPFGLIIVTLLIVGIYALCNKSKKLVALGVGLAWFFVLLAPTSSFVPIITEIAAERRMYLPLLPILIGLAWLVGKCPGRQVILFLLAGVLAIGNATHLQIYRSELTLYEDAIAKFPTNHRARRNLASWYFTHGEFEQAVENYRAVLEQSPQSFSVRHDMGLALVKLNRLQEALVQFEQVAAALPQNIDNLNELGTTFARLGQLDQAEKVLLQAAGQSPTNARVADNLARVYRLRQDPASTKKWLHKLIKLEPNNAIAYNELGIFFATQGQPIKAAAAFKRAVKLAPDWPDAQANLQRIEQQIKNTVPSP